MKVILLIVSIVTIFSGCGSRNILYTDRGLAPSRSKSLKIDKTFYVDLETLTGNIVYIDRKYFKQAFNDTLELHGAKNEFNEQSAHVNISIEQEKLDENYFKSDYKDATQYRLDRKLRVKVYYSIYGKSTYNSSFTYNVLVKSGSYVSYEDADRKAHIKLFRQLGKMVANRILKLRRKFK